MPRQLEWWTVLPSYSVSRSFNTLEEAEAYFETESNNSWNSSVTLTHHKTIRVEERIG